MKNRIVLFLLIFATQLSAKSWRVNNTPNTDPDFTNLIDAHAAASTGDTLYVEGSADSYGPLTVTKRLAIIGPGYFLDKNPDNAVSVDADISRLTFDPTITNDPSSGAAGAVLIGMVIGRGTSASSTLIINVNNVIIQKCSLEGVLIQHDRSSTTPATGVQIIQNYFRGSNDISETSSSTGPIVNIQIINNIFTGALSLDPNSSGAIVHNLFMDGLYVPGFSGEIRSNILMSTSARNVDLPVLPNNQITHNTGGNGQFGDANGNRTTSSNVLFVGGESTDGQWQLLPNSPASGNAHDNTDRGPFGGTKPYSLSGQAGRPAIISLEVQNSGTANQLIKVKMIVKSNN